MLERLRSVAFLCHFYGEKKFRFTTINKDKAGKAELLHQHDTWTDLPGKLHIHSELFEINHSVFTVLNDGSEFMDLEFNRKIEWKSSSNSVASNIFPSTSFSQRWHFEANDNLC